MSCAANSQRSHRDLLVSGIIVTPAVSGVHRPRSPDTLDAVVFIWIVTAYKFSRLA